MSTMTMQIEHEGNTYSGQVGTVRSTSLGVEDHGIMTAFVFIEWAGGGVGVGGYALDDYDETAKRRLGGAFGMDQIMAILDTLGVSEWGKLPGTPAIAVFPAGDPGWGGRSIGLASPTTGRVLILADHAAWWQARTEAAS